MQTGASETRVRLPRAAGATNVKAEAGAASLTFEVPAGVAARIRNRMAIGSTHIDEVRFPRVGDIYQSLDYATAENRIDMDIQGGVGIRAGGRRAVGGRRVPTSCRCPSASRPGLGFGVQIPIARVRYSPPDW